MNAVKVLEKIYNIIDDDELDDDEKLWVLDSLTKFLRLSIEEPYIPNWSTAGEEPLKLR